MFDKLTDSENGLVITMNWITDCLFLSLLWLLFSVFFIPFGPATAALYDTAVHVFRRGEKIVYRRFFRSMRQNLRGGILAGLVVLLALWGGFRLWNRIGAAAENSQIGYMLLWAFFVAFLVALGVLGLILPLLSRFETGTVRLFINGLFLGLSNLPRTLALSMLTAVAIWLCVWLWWPVVFVPCLWAIVAGFFLEPVFAPFMGDEGNESADADTE